MWPEPEIRARVKRFARIADIIIPDIVPNVVENDPADDHILACAVSGKADVIVSGDKRHLLPLKEYEGIPIVRPADFLRMLGGL
jgi:predicted nucleic acid-binding protein